MSELRYTDEEIAAIFRSAADDRQIVGEQLPRESGQRLIAIDPVCAG